MTATETSRPGNRLADLDGFDLVLRLSSVAVVITSHHDPVLMVLAALAAVLLNANSGLRHNAAVWLAGGVAMLAYLATNWYHYDNHVWLTAGWVLAVGLSLLGDEPRRVLAADGRVLIGLVFAVGTAWKLGSESFRSTDFFHYELLQDERFGFVARHFGGLSQASLDQGQASVGALVGAPSEPVELSSSGRIETVAAVFTWWGIVLEAAIAVTWLAPLRGRTRVARHIALLTFAATTYLVVPVGGFACLLMVMALTRDDEASWLRPTYVAAFVVLLLYGPIWGAVAGP